MDRAVNGETAKRRMGDTAIRRYGDTAQEEQRIETKPTANERE